jgi:putative exporter of polyketide antibiotics
VPAEHLTVVPLAALTLLAGALAGLAVRGFRRRDVPV